jgi:hypothetical protein
MASDAKLYYFDLIANDMLLSIYPDLTGVWESDKDWFNNEYKNIMD